MVIYGFWMRRSFWSWIAPDTSNTHTRGPEASTQARREPLPESFRLVTLYISPPRPAGVDIPKPAAPGITGTACAAWAAVASPSANNAGHTADLIISYPLIT